MSHYRSKSKEGMALKLMGLVMCGLLSFCVAGFASAYSYDSGAGGKSKSEGWDYHNRNKAKNNGLDVGFLSPGPLDDASVEFSVIRGKLFLGGEIYSKTSYKRKNITDMYYDSENNFKSTNETQHRLFNPGIGYSISPYAMVFAGVSMELLRLKRGTTSSTYSDGSFNKNNAMYVPNVGAKISLNNVASIKVSCAFTRALDKGQKFNNLPAVKYDSKPRTNKFGLSLLMDL